MEDEIKKEMTPKEKAEQLSKIFIDIETAIKWVEGELYGDNLMFKLKDEWIEDYWYLVQVKSELEKL
jgi:hypothetical protein